MIKNLALVVTISTTLRGRVTQIFNHNIIPFFYHSLVVNPFGTFIVPLFFSVSFILFSSLFLGRGPECCLDNMRNNINYKCF